MGKVPLHKLKRHLNLCSLLFIIEIFELAPPRRMRAGNEASPGSESKADAPSVTADGLKPVSLQTP